MSKIVDIAIQEATDKQRIQKQEQEIWLFDNFQGFTSGDFFAEGIQIRVKAGLHTGNLHLQVELVDGTWSEIITNLAELGEFFQTTLEKEWKIE